MELSLGILNNFALSSHLQKCNSAFSKCSSTETYTSTIITPLYESLEKTF